MILFTRYNAKFLIEDFLKHPGVEGILSTVASSKKGLLLWLFNCQVIVWLFVTPWNVAHWAPLSMRFPRQEYWVGCYFLLQGIFPTQGSNPHFLHCRILYHWASWEAQVSSRKNQLESYPEVPVHSVVCQAISSCSYQWRKVFQERVSFKETQFCYILSTRKKVSLELGIWLRFQVNLEMSREQTVIFVQCVSSDKHRNRCSKVFTESIITMPVHNQNNIYVLIHLLLLSRFSRVQLCATP